MQEAYINAIYDLAEKDANVISVLSDSGTQYDEYFKRDFPNQCINFGIAEEHMVAAAAGMASCGKIPFVYTTGAFIAYRALEFLRDDICLPCLNVKLIGMGSGLSWSTLGATHHTIEDISVLRAIPNLTLLCPASPKEVEWAIKAAYEIKGPVYVRIGMKGEREIYQNTPSLSVEENVTLTEGDDIAIFVTGSIISEVLDAQAKLKEDGIQARVINVHTLKPFQSQELNKAVKEVSQIFSVEEHNIYGGLGGIISEVLAESASNTPSLSRIGLKDCFARGYGTLSMVREMNGLDANGIYETILAAIKNK